MTPEVTSLLILQSVIFCYVFMTGLTYEILNAYRSRNADTADIVTGSILWPLTALVMVLLCVGWAGIFVGKLFRRRTRQTLPMARVVQR